jgi:chaperonin GroES
MAEASLPMRGRETPAGGPGSSGGWTAGSVCGVISSGKPSSGGTSSGGTSGGAVSADGRLPIRMLHDRVLVSTEGEDGERRSGGGIVIPATAAFGRRLSWAAVVAVGQHVRQVQVGDRVLFDAEESAQVELHGSSYELVRERDLHAVAATRVDDGQTGLYL